ncbi:MAG: hypothetical protein M1831_003139 [Alyxoria varia]|nr:MAG: hypothetical protein M1831_003139 [Alyxoria varia]
MAPDNSEYFFQSASTQSNFARKASKANSTAGDPIKLGVKLNAVIFDPRSGQRPEPAVAGGGGDGRRHQGGQKGRTNAAVFVADSTGVARRIDVETGKQTHSYPGSNGHDGQSAPLTSLAVYQPPQSHSPLRLFASSWDNSIYSWDATSMKLLRRYENGHTDFVKCIACARLSPTSPLEQSADIDAQTTRAQPSNGDAGEGENGDHDNGGVLISGGADARVIVWSIATGDRLHIVRAHSRGVLDVAIEPPLTSRATNTDAGESTPAAQEAVTVYSASSLGDLRSWLINRKEAKSVSFMSNSDAATGSQQTKPTDIAEGEEEGSIMPHETSINALKFTSLSALFPSFSPDELSQLLGASTSTLANVDTDSSPATATAILTASSDNTAKCLLLPRVSPPAETEDSSAAPPPKPWALFTLPHPDFVRDVALIPALGSSEEPLIATACRDENVRLWSVPEDPSEVAAAQHAPSGRGIKLGNRGEMKPLAVFEGHNEEVTGLGVVGTSEGQRRLISVSLDGTIRRWGLSQKDIGAYAAKVEDEDGQDGMGVMGAREEAGMSDFKEVKENRGNKKAVRLTEEEERELAELNDLMEDDE